MTIHWLTFFVAAPVWGSLGILLFAVLTRQRVEDQNRALRAQLDELAEQFGRDVADPDVIYLPGYRSQDFPTPPPIGRGA